MKTCTKLCSKKRRTMKKRVLLLSALFFAVAPAVFGKAKNTHRKAKTVVISRFQTQLQSIINTANGQQGMDALKHTELVTGIWDCSKELEGFLPTIVLDQYHPADRLILKAETINASAATRNVRTLIQHGLPGYKLRDSDKDKTMPVDRTLHSRTVTLTRRDRYKETIVTFHFNAHRQESITIFVETFALHLPS